MFVRLALKVVMQNDGDLVDLIPLYLRPGRLNFCINAFVTPVSTVLTAI
jgi:hypothetical protein